MSIQEKRLKLRELSEKAKKIKDQLIEDAKTPQEALNYSALRINDIIIKYFYKSPEHQEFHTFKGWLKEGHAVKKGEKAFLVWGRPKAVQEQEKNPQAENDEESDFFPVSYIFSNAQVQPLNQKESA